MTTVDLRQAARAFEQAVDMAAQGSGDVHDRLVLAWQRSLVTLRPDTFPSPVRADARITPFASGNSVVRRSLLTGRP